MNRPHVDVGPRPVNLSAGLPSGRYVAQVRLVDSDGGGGVLYATTAAAPADPQDWFAADRGAFFEFAGGSSVTPTWARTSGARTVSGAADAFAVLAVADKGDC